MRAIVHSEEGVLSLNYLWLPTVIGMNTVLKQSLEKDLQEKLVGTQADETGLDQAHDIVVQYLCEKFPGVRGLRGYLDALKTVEL